MAPTFLCAYPFILTTLRGLFSNQVFVYQTLPPGAGLNNSPNADQEEGTDNQHVVPKLVVKNNTFVPIKERATSLQAHIFPRACLLLADLVYDFSTMPFGSFRCLFCLKHKLCICIFSAFNSLLSPYLFSVIIQRLMPILLGFCSSPAAFSNIFVLSSMLSFLLEFSFNNHKT